MKFKLASLFILLLTFSNVRCQELHQQKGFNTPIHPINSTTQVHPEIPVLFGVHGQRTPAADKYILDFKTLSAYFKHGKIPRAFPLYDTDLSFEANKQGALRWTKCHKWMLTKEKRDWLTKKSNV
jgi:hypothetical protein